MTDDAPKPQVKIDALCQRHAAALVGHLRFRKDDPWRALTIVAHIALFQGHVAQIKDDPVHLPSLSNLGCLACRHPDLFEAIIDAAQKVPLDQRIAAIKALGERWVQDASASPDRAGGEAAPG